MSLRLTLLMLAALGAGGLTREPRPSLTALTEPSDDVFEFMSVSEGSISEFDLNDDPQGAEVKTGTLPGHRTVKEELEKLLPNETKKADHKPVTESETSTEGTPNNLTLTTSVDNQTLTGKEGHGNFTEQTQYDKISNVTDEKTKEATKEIDEGGEIESLAVAEKKVGTKSTERGRDEPQKIERTEVKIENLPGNKTKEVLVKETAEKLPSDEVENKTITENGTLTEGTPKNFTRTKTVEIEKLIDQEGDKNTTVETQTEKLSNGTNEETIETKKVIDEGGEMVNVTVTDKKIGTNDTERNETKANVITSVPDKKDEPQKVERTKEKTEELLGNGTKEILKKEESETLPSNERKKAEDRNVTENKTLTEEITKANIANLVDIQKNATEKKVETSKTDKNETKGKAASSVVDAKDEPQKVERTEQNTETLGNGTIEISLKAKVECFPSNKTIKKKLMKCVCGAEKDEFQGKKIPVVTMEKISEGGSANTELQNKPVMTAEASRGGNVTGPLGVVKDIQVSQVMRSGLPSVMKDEE